MTMVFNCSKTKGANNTKCVIENLATKPEPTKPTWMKKKAITKAATPGQTKENAPTLLLEPYK